MISFREMQARMLPVNCSTPNHPNVQITLHLNPFALLYLLFEEGKFLTDV
nr:hypothetical protein [Leptospira interrogans]